jgi:dienelactone hydrolase
MLRTSLRNLGALLAVAILIQSSFAAGPQVLKPGEPPHDARLAPPKDLDGYFPFTPPANKEAWNARAERLRTQVLISQGLYPLPTKTPLNAVIYGKLDRGDYTVEKVFFESQPGFFVTGNLYRPVGKTGKLPAILCPHGHWNNGRFYDSGRDNVRRSIVEGAERFEEGGRSPLQSRCVQLARMGCVVFHYDMLGYADSIQLSFELAHRFGIPPNDPRASMNKTDAWGLFSPQAESHLQSVMGLQTWNSIRSVDFVESLPDVDPSRIGVTGSSGGGTQTFLLAGVEPRIAVAVPAVMVSTAMQGGCTCENACLLRVGTGNVELAALFAPKPLMCISADDWTKEMPTKGFPELQQHYAMLGAPKNVAHRPLLQFGHNYNYVSRAGMYSWFNKNFKLGIPEPVVEEAYDRLTPEEMTVWDSAHPKPVAGDDFERRLCRTWHEDSQQQWAKATANPADRDRLMRNTWSILTACDPVDGGFLPPSAEIEYEQSIKNDHGDYLEMAGVLRNKLEKSELPVSFLYPKDWNGKVVLWLSEQGKQGLYTADGQPVAAAKKLLASGASIMGIDLLYQGEFLTDGQPLTQTPVVKNPRPYAGFTFGYNPTVFAYRVHDVLTALSYLREHERQPKQVCLVALDQTAPIAAVAQLLSTGAADRVALDTHGFRFANVADFRSPDFLPGSAKYGDLPGVLSACGKGQLWLAGEPQTTIADRENVTRYEGDAGKSAEVVAEWLIK